MCWNIVKAASYHLASKLPFEVTVHLVQKSVHTSVHWLTVGLQVKPFDPQNSESHMWNLIVSHRVRFSQRLEAKRHQNWVTLRIYIVIFHDNNAETALHLHNICAPSPHFSPLTSSRVCYHLGVRLYLESIKTTSVSLTLLMPNKRLSC